MRKNGENEKGERIRDERDGSKRDTKCKGELTNIGERER